MMHPCYHNNATTTAGVLQTCQSFALVSVCVLAVALFDHDAAPDTWAKLAPAVRQPPVGGVRPLHDGGDKGHTDLSHLSGQQQGDRHLPLLL